jgi:hypothetical protein
VKTLGRRGSSKYESLWQIARRIVDRTPAVVLGHQAIIEKTSPSIMIALKSRYMTYRKIVEKRGKSSSIGKLGHRIFSQFDEEGIMVSLLGVIGIGPICNVIES